MPLTKARARWKAEAPLKGDNTSLVSPPFVIVVALTAPSFPTMIAAPATSEEPGACVFPSAEVCRTEVPGGFGVLAAEEAEAGAAALVRVKPATTLGVTIFFAQPRALPASDFLSSAIKPPLPIIGNVITNV